MQGFISAAFPFLFGGTFIEGAFFAVVATVGFAFPFLFGGTFIEGGGVKPRRIGD